MSRSNSPSRTPSLFQSEKSEVAAATASNSKKKLKPSEKENLCSTLMNRIYWGDAEGVADAIREGADVNKIYVKDFMPYEFIYELPGLESPIFLAVKVAAKYLNPPSPSIRDLIRLNQNQIDAQRAKNLQQREKALEVIRVLIQNGADLNEKDVMRTSLTAISAVLGDTVVVNMLLTAGARRSEISGGILSPIMLHPLTY